MPLFFFFSNGVARHNLINPSYPLSSSIAPSTLFICLKFSFLRVVGLPICYSSVSNSNSHMYIYLHVIHLSQILFLMCFSSPSISVNLWVPEERLLILISLFRLFKSSTNISSSPLDSL